jgi:hypothetical protein
MVWPSTDNLYSPSGSILETHSILRRQFLESLVPSRITLVADTMQFAVCPLPRKTPIILTDSRVNVMVAPFQSGGNLFVNWITKKATPKVNRTHISAEAMRRGNQPCPSHNSFDGGAGVERRFPLIVSLAMP